MMLGEDMIDADNQYRTNNNHWCYYKHVEQANVDMLPLMNDDYVDDRQMTKKKIAASLVHNRLSNEHKFSISAQDDGNWIHMITNGCYYYLLDNQTNVTVNMDDINRFFSSFSFFVLLMASALSNDIFFFFLICRDICIDK